MSPDLRTTAEREADNARLNQAVAEDVAVGMAVKADAEHARANNFAVGAAVEAARADALGTAAVREAVRADSALNDRDTALATASRANRDARNSSMAFYLLLGAVAVASLVGLLWYFNRPQEAATATPTPVGNRAPAPAAPTVPRTVSAPPVAAPAPPPVIIERKVVVPVDRPVAVPVPVDRPVPVVVPGPAPQNDAPATTPAPATDAPASGTGEKPLRGYVEPTNGGGQ